MFSSSSAMALKACQKWLGMCGRSPLCKGASSHLIRNTFRLASKKDWDALKRDVKPIYTAPNPNAAKAALADLAERWGSKYGAIIRLWESSWEEFIPFLDYGACRRMRVEQRRLAGTSVLWA
jgi:hypothetical protein